MKMLYLGTYLYILTIAVNCYAQADEALLDLVPYRSDGKWGLSDTSGQLIYEPKYEAFRSLPKGFFALGDSKKHKVLVGNNGKMLINTHFKIKSVSSSYITVEIPEKNGVKFFTYSSSTEFLGDTTIYDCITSEAESEYDSLLYTRTYSGKTGIAKQSTSDVMQLELLLDTIYNVVFMRGKTIIAIDSTRGLTETYRPVIDRDGINLKLIKSQSFNDKETGPTFVLSRSRYINQYRYRSITDQGKTAVEISYGNRVGYDSVQYRVLDTVKLDHARIQLLRTRNIRNGVYPIRRLEASYAAFENETGQWGVIDTTGTVIIPPTLEWSPGSAHIKSTRGNSSVYFICKNRQKTGVLNNKNDTILPFIYKKIDRERVYNMYAPDKKTSKVIFRVETNNGKMIVDEEGKHLLPFYYERTVLARGTEVIGVQSENNYGVLAYLRYQEIDPKYVVWNVRITYPNRILLYFLNKLIRKKAHAIGYIDEHGRRYYD